MQVQTVCLSEKRVVKPNHRLKRMSMTRFHPDWGWYEYFDDSGSAAAITASLIGNLRSRDVEPTPVT